MVQRCVILHKKKLKTYLGFGQTQRQRCQGVCILVQIWKIPKHTINLNDYFLWKLLLYTAGGFSLCCSTKRIHFFLSGTTSCKKVKSSTPRQQQCLALAISSAVSSRFPVTLTSWSLSLVLALQLALESGPRCSSSSQVSSVLPSFSNITREFLYQAAKV